MRRLLLLLTGILLTVASCQKDYVLTANVPWVEDGTLVYLSQMTKGNKPIAIDTAQVKKGKAELNLPKVDFQTLNTLTVEGVNGNMILINENQSLKAEIDIEEMRKSSIEGGKANALLQKYSKLLAKGNEKSIGVTEAMSREEMQDPTRKTQVQQLQQQIQKENSEFRKKAIAENPDQFASILMFTDMLRGQQVSHSEMKKLYDGLSKDVQNTYIGKEIGNQLSKSAAVAVGSKAPSFTAKTPEGEELALEDALGKYTLLDFWAAWCLPCRKENPNIVNVYNEYKDSGFTVLGVSLDKDRQKWLDAIEKDGLEWNQVSNLQFWQDPIAKDYNIKAIPANFLLDENGTIIAQNLRGPALQQKIDELLGKYLLSIEVPGVSDGTPLYLTEMAKGNQPIALDTAEVVQGQAELYLPKVDFQTLNLLTVEGVNGNAIIINENQPLQGEINIAEMRKSSIEGGESNALFQEYYELLGNANEKIIGVTDGLSQEELKDPARMAQIQQLQQQIQKENSEFRKKAIAENPDQFASILMFSDMLRRRQVSHAEMKKLYDGLSKEVQNTYIGKEIGNQLSKSAAVAVGSKAPSFSAKTPEGEELALEDALGKYTLLDFWAAWCLPCRKENPNIVSVYDEYKDRGFTVLGVSLDKDRQKWLDAIEKDGLEWNQVSNLKFWQDPIAKEYNIKAIPQSFLLDENGKIIAQNLRGPALRNKMEELLGDE